MWIRTVWGTWVLLLSSWLCLSATASGQVINAGCNDTPGKAPVEWVIRGQPFSALSYVRTFAVGQDGNRRFVRNERYPIRIARNATGCLRIDIVDNPQDACAQLDVLVPPLCRDWDVAVFDLAHQAVTHWTGGDRGYPGSVVVRLDPSQLGDAVRYTSEVPVPATETASDEPDIRVEILGEKVIEGLGVVGVRETRTVRVGAAQPVVATIHEVWMSPGLRLVVQVIDGDPRKQLTIAGLDHVKREVDETLFQPVAGYPVRILPVHLPDYASYAAEDVRHLSFWFVRSFDGGE